MVTHREIHLAIELRRAAGVTTAGTKEQTLDTRVLRSIPKLMNADLAE